MLVNHSFLQCQTVVSVSHTNAHTKMYSLIYIWLSFPYSASELAGVTEGAMFPHVSSAPWCFSVS